MKSNPLNKSQYTYQTNPQKYISTSITELVTINKSIENNEVAIVCFLDIDNLIENTCFECICDATKIKEIDNTICSCNQARLTSRTIKS